MSTLKRQITDSPLIDEIVYQCQEILQGIVVKNEDEANKYETAYSIKQSDFYSIIVEGKATFEMFNYTYNILKQIPTLSANDIYVYMNNKDAIPDTIRPLLTKLAAEDFLANYQEVNDYYRTLYGLPLYGHDGIKLSDDLISMLPVDNFDTGKYIHEMDNNEITILESAGILDIIREEYTGKEYKYLYHLGEKRVNPYVARNAANFSILYMPGVEAMEVYNKFKERFEINRVYILKTVYCDAYKFNNENFDKIIIILITLQTLDDMVVLSPEYIISRDLFDLRTIEYIFDMNGVEFFKEIPLKYQKRLVKNLNRLIKFRSTDKNIVDIVSLFGFDDIEIFKYYLMKQPVVNEDGTYRHDTYKDPITGEDKEDLESNYELKFIKVPLDGVPDDYIKDPKAVYSYNSIVADDIYWDGIYSHEYVREQILKHEYNLCISKYLSIDTVYSLTELSFELVYFINMIMFSKVNTDNLLIEVPELSSTSKYSLIDILICLYSLMYMYNGIQDEIKYDPVQVMAILGFNFEVDMNTLSSYIQDKGYTAKDLGIEDFQNPSTIFTFNQLIDVYTKNKNIFKHLIHEINNANNKEIYDLYMKIYKSLMITKANFQYYRRYSINGKDPATYSEVLNNKNSSLYAIIMECNNITKIADRQEAISKYINILVENVYIYLDKEEFRFIFQNIPTVSLDYIRVYLFKVLNFFKSYKVDVIHSNILYKFDSRLDNKINIIDEIIFNYLLNPDSDHINVIDFQKLLIKCTENECIDVLEHIYFDITHWNLQHFDDKIPVNEEINKILISITLKDNGNITKDEIYEIIRRYQVGFNIDIEDVIDELKLDNILSEKVNMKDAIYFDYIR